MKILVTGAAGFIGFHLAKKLLREKTNIVIGIDNIDNYYDIKIKKDRLKQLRKFKNFYFYKINICKKNQVEKIFSKFRNIKLKFLICLFIILFKVANIIFLSKVRT